MDIEQRLSDYKKSIKIDPDEQSIKETVKKSIEVYCSSEQDQRLSYWEFLRAQLRLIRKRWWLLQVLLLVLLWILLSSVHGTQLIQRILGVSASLFIILIVPELWKNQTYRTMEIEAVSYYSLRQIYAARMLLFGIVDILLITLFCKIAAMKVNISFSQLLVQFIFPMTVTTAICFENLCSKYAQREATAIMMCTAWSAIWLTIISNDKIYAAITMPLWLIFIGAAFLFLALTIYRTLRYCNTYWEVNTNGTGIG